MGKLLPACALALLVPSLTASAEPGVAQTLARERAAQIHALRYVISASVGADAMALQGRLSIHFDLREPAAVTLDYRPQPGGHAGAWQVNGRTIEPVLADEHAVLEARWLRAGANEVSLDFSAPILASGGALTRYTDTLDNARYVYSLFVPADASSVFPCFDQPDLKAVWSLNLTVPQTWRAVSNGRLKGLIASDGQMRLEFADTKPLPTYLFAFAAGPFAQLNEAGLNDAGVSEAGLAPGTTLYVRASQKARAGREAAEVLRLSRESNVFFARYFDHPFPFDKHDLVLLPEFPYGGMEHAGAVFLREESILFRAPPTQADLLRRASLIFHENSHQWFGNLVTMRWFDDLWLKEGFANFAAAKAIEALLPPLFPEIDAGNARRAAKIAAYRTDVTLGTTAIYQALTNLANAKSVYGAIVYTKAPAVLRQAEFFLGDAVFERAVRRLLRERAYANAEWRDLVTALEAESGKTLGAWADTWVKRRGIATVRVARPAQSGAPYAVSQADSLGENGIWPMRFKLGFIDAQGKGSERTVQLDGARTEVTAPAGKPPLIVVPNYGDYGYARFLLDDVSSSNAMARPDLLRAALTRGLVFDGLWERVREAELAPRDYLAFSLRVLPMETDPIIYAGLLARTGGAFRQYLSDAQRDAMAVAIERALRERMDSAPTTGARLQAMRTLIEMAWSRAGLKTLTDLLDGRLVIGITGDRPALSPRDRFAVVQRLLIRAHPQGERRLAFETARTAGEDTASFAFAAGAARADRAVKQRTFERFLQDSALAESWIDQALGPLNAIEHAAATAPLLPAALDALPRLKRDRKIFFVGDWLSAFIGGQVDAAALDLVKRFAALDGLDADLALKVLEAVDALERTVRIRARYGQDRVSAQDRGSAPSAR